MSDKKSVSKRADEVVSKVAMKRKRDESKDDGVGEEMSPSEKRQEWLKEKAKTVKIPEEDAAVIKPAHIFLEQGPLIIHLCTDCKKFNGQRAATIIGEGRVELPLGLCTICRHHLNRQRSVRFFEHELAAIKRDMDL